MWKPSSAFRRQSHWWEDEKLRDHDGAAQCACKEWLDRGEPSSSYYVGKKINQFSLVICTITLNGFGHGDVSLGISMTGVSKGLTEDGIQP